MGSWGPGPYDNDTAADWFGHVNNDLLPKIKVALESDDFDLIRAGAWMLGQVAVSSYTGPCCIPGQFPEGMGTEREHFFNLAMKGLASCLERATDPEFIEEINVQMAHLARVANGDYALPTLGELVKDKIGED